MSQINHFDRLNMELASIDMASAKLRYLGYSPKTNSFSEHIKAFGNALHDELHKREQIALAW